ncbi:DUF389 domain-containing protein [Neolewinella lacunae]|uniref:DUF389 domain-containing protein n=1 Tax=Neolewinella lacunae TaxID=1517758 RepID=A0A923TC53_9BACT|nr:DUF389 domain-containing protein [Neolewinella lacunae]MBC6993342.1 DUF389 domain-containing protein [Neolewinella lacunae]MDN3636332.1 DUF389 domain-containing protein [Neolewinella lacunae]
MLPEETKPEKHVESSPAENLRSWFRDFMNLRTGSDRAGAVQSIVNGKQMRGSNAWMLVCSIMIASLGLNLNSSAVIIGAMLISPLMNPILGIGLAVGTNDRDLLWQALRNFGISIIIALLTSVLYFSLSPLNEFTNEMQARTEPTILDALVAIFGGLAGIISVTREEKTSAIPGVAIATALMPPLCVAGYGIALSFTEGSLGFSVFWRAFYLFFINSFFIATTAYIIIRLLRFPYRKYINQREALRSRLIIGLVSILIILPGFYILRQVLNNHSYRNAASAFTARYFPESKSTYVFNADDPNAPLLIFPVRPRSLSADSLDFYNERLRNDPYRIPNARIVTDTSVASLQDKLNLLNNHGSRIAQLERTVSSQAAALESLLQVAADENAEKSLATRLQLAFPGISSVYVQQRADGQAASQYVPLVAIQRSWPGVRPNTSVLRAERQRLQAYLQSELRVDSLLLVIEEI